MRRFSKDSLARKMMRWFMLIILVPSSVLSIVLYATAAGRNYDTLVGDYSAMLGMVAENIQNNAALVENIMEVLSYNSDILKLLTDEKQNQFSRVIAQQYDVSDVLAQSKAFLAPLGANIVLFAEDARVPVSYWYLLNMWDVQGEPDYQAFLASGKNAGWVGLGPIYPESTVIYSANNREMFCYYRKILTVTGLGRCVGVLKCGVELDQFFSAIEIPDFEGNLYVYQGDALIYQSASVPALEPLDDAVRGSKIVGSKLYLNRSIDPLQVRLMMCVDVGPVLRQALISGLPSLLAAVMSSVFILLATQTFLSSIQKRMDQAVEFAKEVRKGNMNISFPDPGKNEIGQLIDSFNALLEQLQKEAQERIKHEKAEKHALQLALQYQVNPHFLFNTLNWIQMTAELGTERELLSRAITLLGKLLRYNLDEQITATLAEEMENTRTYVQLMNMRKHDRIFVTFETQGISDDMVLARFLFQPLCENAIQHGIVGDQSLHIRISGRIQNDWAYFEIENDGAMIPEEKLANLEIHSIAAQKKRGVGLANVYARLRLLYGDQTSLTVTSCSERTRVSVSFPMKTMGKEDVKHEAADC